MSPILNFILGAIVLILMGIFTLFLFVANNFHDDDIINFLEKKTKR